MASKQKCVLRTFASTVRAKNPTPRTRPLGAPERKPGAPRTQQLLQQVREVAAQREERRNPGCEERG
eukprot:7758909-Pyramimonas_sp.AAC.1